jgi:hypothetical protein
MSAFFAKVIVVDPVMLRVYWHRRQHHLMLNLIGDVGRIVTGFLYHFVINSLPSIYKWKFVIKENFAHVFWEHPMR